MDSFKKGNKKRIARLIRNHTGIPARKICRTMKNDQMIEELSKYESVNYFIMNELELTKYEKEMTLAQKIKCLVMIKEYLLKAKTALYEDDEFFLNRIYMCVMIVIYVKSIMKLSDYNKQIDIEKVFPEFHRSKPKKTQLTLFGNEIWYPEGDIESRIDHIENLLNQLTIK